MAMNSDEWREFLGELSRIILALDVPKNDDVNRPHFSDEVRATGYIGCAGAAESQIAAAEARLDCVFPPSYRAFLSVSNGWPAIWHSVEPGRLWECGQIQWGNAQEPLRTDIIETECEYLRKDKTSNPDFPAAVNPLSISDNGDACELWLLSEVAGEEGEWECWKGSSWGGVDRWASFERWFRDVLEFHRQQSLQL